MTINERFKIIINELYSGNKRSFANAVGVNPTVIENVVGSRGGNPSFEVIQKVLTANANISADWLILENGQMLRNEIIKDIIPNQSTPIIDSASMGFILDRYESLAVENAILKKENEDLKQSRGTSSDSIIYTDPSQKLSTSIAAEPAHK